MSSKGGARPGAGRKRILDLGQKKREEIIRDVQAEAKNNGTSFGQELGRIIFGAGSDKRLKLSAMQLYVRDVLPRVSERDVNEPSYPGPVIYLPEQRPAMEPIDDDARH